MKYLVNPQFNELEQFTEFVQNNDLALEYDDFFSPNIYENEEEINRRIAGYCTLDRDRSQDTLHGAFLGLDIAASDYVLRDRSRKLYEQSMEIAAKLGVKGVVFHTGLIGNLRVDYYINNWLKESEDFFRYLTSKYPSLEIYLENSFEQEPNTMVALAEKMDDVKNFGLCLDYAHAVLTTTPVDTWCKAFAPYLKHMHINDNDLKNDLHLVPGEGSVNFDKYFSLMKKNQINVPTLLEVSGFDKATRSYKYLVTQSEAFDKKQIGTPETSQPQNILWDQDDSELEKVLNIGIALSAEKDPNRLFGLIVNTAMELTSSDGGTLYICKDDMLHFRIMKTLSKGFNRGEAGDVIDIPPVPLKKENICAYAAISGKSLNIEDVYNSNDFDFSGPKRYDAINQYHTQSMVAIPLTNQEGTTIGVLQLINATDASGNIRPFTAKEEQILLALASQTAIALSNMQYVEELNQQLWSFTEAMTEAIDARTPYNASHTRKVAEYSGMIADHINKLHEQGSEAFFFTKEHREQLVMAALLHDIGKLVIPGAVMNKATRLGEKYEKVMDRLEWFRLNIEVDHFRGVLSNAEWEKQSAQAIKAKEIVDKVNGAGFVPDDVFAALTEVLQYTYKQGDTVIPYFTEEEKNSLLIRKGTLTAEERKIMESHVVMTERILSKVHFNRFFKDARIWAARHHECINGEGYPNGIAGDELSLEVRILAVADICDALLASDRPYKKPLPKDKAFAIMHDMAKEGRIEGYLVDYLEACLEGKER